MSGELLIIESIQRSNSTLFGSSSVLTHIANFAESLTKLLNA